jgi:hypothetical protein
MFVLTSPLPLKGGEQDLPTPLTFGFFVFLLAFLVALPLCSLVPMCCFYASYNNTRKSTSTIAIASRGEQNLPTPLLVLLFTCLCYCIVLAIVVVLVLV